MIIINLTIHNFQYYFTINIIIIFLIDLNLIIITKP